MDTNFELDSPWHSNERFWVRINSNQNLNFRERGISITSVSELRPLTSWSEEGKDKGEAGKALTLTRTLIYLQIGWPEEHTLRRQKLQESQPSFTAECIFM